MAGHGVKAAPRAMRKSNPSINAVRQAVTFAVVAFPFDGFAVLRRWIPAFAGMTREGWGKGLLSLANFLSKVVGCNGLVAVGGDAVLEHLGF